MAQRLYNHMGQVLCTKHLQFVSESKMVHHSNQCKDCLNEYNRRRRAKKSRLKPPSPPVVIPKTRVCRYCEKERRSQNSIDLSLQEFLNSSQTICGDVSSVTMLWQKRLP